MLVAACSGAAGEAEADASSPADSGADEGDTSASSDTSTNAEEETGPGQGQACTSSADCDPGHCVAPWDEATASPLGPYTCRLACVQAFDSSVLCADDDACCEALSCDALGICVDPNGSGSDETSGDESSTTG